MSDRTLLALLTFNGLLLGVLGLMFTPLYISGIPVPIGVVATIVILPWLVSRAGEVDARPVVAAAPLYVWAVTVGGLGLLGPGGDVMLLAGWQSLLLFFGGLGAGMMALRAAIEEDVRRRLGG